VTEPTPKVIARPVPVDYADLDEDERLAVAGTLAEAIREDLR